MPCTPHLASSARAASYSTISGNLVGLHGGKAIVDAMQANASLKVVDLRFNSLDAAVVGEAVGKLEGREGVRVEG